MTMQIKNGQLVVYDVDTEYLKYLRQFDKNVHLKDTRRFCGLLVTKDGQDYCIPLSTKVIPSSGKRRKSELTTTIMYKKTPIAVLLYNNMIPVTESVVRIVDVTKDRDRDYLKNELRFLHSNEMEVIVKADNTLNDLSRFQFFRNLCCDFDLLTEKCKEWELSHGKDNSAVELIEEVDEINKEEIF